MEDLMRHHIVLSLSFQYEDIATKYQNYMPGKPYHQLLQTHAENGTDVVLEKYQFEGYQDNPANAKDR